MSNWGFVQSPPPSWWRIRSKDSRKGFPHGSTLLQLKHRWISSVIDGNLTADQDDTPPKRYVKYYIIQLQDVVNRWDPPKNKGHMYTYMLSIFLKRKNYSNQPTDQWYHHPGSERIHLSTEEEDGGGTFDSDSVFVGIFVEIFWEGKNTHRIWAVFGFGRWIYCEYSLGEAPPVAVVESPSPGGHCYWGPYGFFAKHHFQVITLATESFPQRTCENRWRSSQNADY